MEVMGKPLNRLPVGSFEQRGVTSQIAVARFGHVCVLSYPARVGAAVFPPSGLFGLWASTFSVVQDAKSTPTTLLTDKMSLVDHHCDIRTVVTITHSGDCRVHNS